MHITVNNIEIYKEILPLASWYDAKVISSVLGDGWRLPTIEELNTIYENKKLGNFGCWSDTISDDSFTMVWSKGFETGNVYLNEKTNKNRVLLVRTINVDKEYWSQDLPYPLSPSDHDVEIYKTHLLLGTTLLLGCTKKLIPLSDRQLDIDPWYNNDTVIIGDWVKNKHFYTNIILDGGLCFTKELCDGILKMASNNCVRFITRSFSHKLDIMRVANYFPKMQDFAIEPNKTILIDNYKFYIWDFKTTKIL